MERINFGHRLSTDIPTGTSKLVLPTDTTTDVSRRTYDNDHLFNQLSDLVNTKFRSWYCREFYRLGKDRVLKLASVARADGKNPQRYFSKLIKESA